jgi:hypothetical protein
MINTKRLRELKERVKEAKEKNSPDSQLLDELLREVESSVASHIAYREYHYAKRKES